MAKETPKITEDFPATFCRLARAYCDCRLQAQAGGASGINAHRKKQADEAGATLWKFLKQNGISKSEKRIPPDLATLGFRPHQGELFLTCLDWIYQPDDKDRAERFQASFEELRTLVDWKMDCDYDKIKDIPSITVSNLGGTAPTNSNKIEFLQGNKIEYNKVPIDLTGLEYEILRVIAECDEMKIDELYRKVHGTAPRKGHWRWLGDQWTWVPGHWSR